MPSSSFSYVTFAGVLILAIACSSDNPAGPGAPSQLDASSGPLGSAIRSDIAASAGNAIAGDIETLIANEAAAVGSFAVFAPSSGAFGDDAPASSPSNPPASSGADSTASTPPSEQPNCTAGNQPGVFLCVRQPGPGDHLQCTYSEEKKLYICVKQEQPDSNPPASEPKPPASTPPSGEPQPAPTPSGESCSFNSAALIYSCLKSGEGQTVVKSYQFLDASGKPMEKFVRGVTEAIHFLVKKDASEANDNSSSVSHSLRDVVESGFLTESHLQWIRKQCRHELAEGKPLDAEVHRIIGGFTQGGYLRRSARGAPVSTFRRCDQSRRLHGRGDGRTARDHRGPQACSGNVQWDSGCADLTRRLQLRVAPRYTQGGRL